MIKNYFKIAWRNVVKNKVYSAINIIGLALGMAVAILIGLWVWDELSFNTSFKNHNRIGQILVTNTFDGHTGTMAYTALPLGPELRNKYGRDFKYIAYSTWGEDCTLRSGEKIISQNGLWVQPDLTKILSLKMLKGNANALTDPSSVLLTQSAAKSLFGNDDPMNKTVRINNKYDFKVAGVYHDFASNTNFSDVKILMPWDKLMSTNSDFKTAQTNWGDHSFRLFVQLNDHADFAQVTNKIKAVSRPHFKEGNEWLFVHPMNLWHLHSEFKDGKLVGGRITYVWLFAMIGIFVLLLACINFMNLSTARSEKRAKEVGIRKAIGSVRSQLVYQFLSESVLMSFMALIISILFTLLFLPTFNSIALKTITFPWANIFFWLAVIIFALFTGIISGSYPAFYLSSFRPIAVLKGIFKTGRFAALPRKILVVIQFTVSVALMIGTLIVYKQIQFAKNRPAGYDRGGLITINVNTPELKDHYDALRQDLLKTGAVNNVAQSSSPSTDIWSNQIGFDWQGKNPLTNPILGVMGVSYDFGNTIGWQVKQGRDFSRNFSTDTAGFLINEAAVKMIGFKDPIGQTIKWNGKPYVVKGVVKNMVMNSPFMQPIPTVIYLKTKDPNIITLRLKDNKPVQTSLATVESVFKQYNPTGLFQYKFTDEEYARKFSDEERLGHLANFFAILAILISSLGLFGLAAFVAEQRTKEIGVRKVLGASVYNLWAMLSKDFLVLVIISSFIAIPVAWYFLKDWLLSYEYHTVISWWIFAIAGVGAMMVTLLTVSFQAIKASLANPVKSLRSE